MNFLFIGMISFTCFLQVFTLGLAAKPHQQVILENTLPKEHLNHPKIVTLTKAYRKHLLQLATAFSLISFTFIFISYESILLTFFWLLLFASMTTMYLCKIYYIREMKQLITRNQWQPTIQPKQIDTTLILNKNRKMVSIYWLYLSYLPSFPLSWYAWQVTDLLTASILFGSSTLIFILMLINYYYIGRMPSKSLTNNQTINQEYNDLTKHSWSFITVCLNWLMLPLLFLPIFMVRISGILAILLTIFYSALLLFLVFFTIAYLYSLRKKQDHLLMQTAEYRYTGEDEYWRYGVYINPNDPKLFIPDRIGLNIGVNLGRLAGKILMGGVGLLLAGSVFITLVPAYLYDFTDNPLQLERVDQEIVLSAPFTTTAKIPIAEIEDIHLIDSIPRPIIKTFGSATDNYAIGRFNVATRNAYLFIDHRSQPILKIQTKNVDYYYTNKTPEITIDIYDSLTLP